MGDLHCATTVGRSSGAFATNCPNSAPGSTNIGGIIRRTDRFDALAELSRKVVASCPDGA